jgi:hypothetical protein
MFRTIQKKTRFGLSLILLAGLLAGILALGLTGSVFAHGPVDQYFEGTTGLRGSNLIGRDIGQTFVPTADNLVAVDVIANPFSYNPYPMVRVSIHEGDPDGTELAHADITWGPYGWKHVDFEDPISMTPGNTYSIRLSALSGTPAWNADIGYPNGSLWICEPTCASYDNDLSFRTYYDGVCPAGKYDNGSGCVAVDPGYYVPVAGATEQTPCAQGYYQPAEGSVSCIAASPGYYVDTTGATEQTMCAVGYTSEAGAVECTLEVSNAAPTADAGGPYLGAINTAIDFDGSLSSDPDNDSLTFAWVFGDSGSDTSEMPAHSYSASGIYTVCLTVNDGTVDSDSVCTMAVVYDPSAGFVTGGGWIDSPEGAYSADPILTGKATFGFVSKYKKGASVPTGNTEFQFQAGSFKFHSDSYEWLVVNQGGSNAQFKGSGLVNDGLDPNGNPYKFMLWAGDGFSTAGADTFQIKIWWEDGGVEHDVYDNGTDQAIGGGNIVVHKGK